MAIQQSAELDEAQKLPRPNPVGRTSRLFTLALRQRHLSRLIRPLLVVRGTYLPPASNIGEGVIFHHLASGVICRNNTVIGDRSEIYPGVILGAASLGSRSVIADDCGVVVEEDVVIGSGSYVLAKSKLTVAKGTVLAANSVLLESTEPNSTWAGNPAKPMN